MGLPEPHRLRHYQAFQRVYRAGLRRTSTHLVLRALPIAPRPEADLVTPPLPLLPTQFGITVSLKVSKRAVVRNRIKRRLRAALRSLLPGIPPGWWVVITVRPQVPECGYEQFLQELEQLLLALEVLDGH